MRFEQAIDIDASQQQVWDVLTELDAWPLTIPGGMLRCEGRGAVSIQSDEGIIYAVNAVGKAWSQTNNLGWSDVALLQADDTAAGGKMKLGPLIAAGLRLCREAGQGGGATTTTSG